MSGSPSYPSTWLKIDDEEGQRRPGGEEVVHVGIPRAVEARDERQLGVVVEHHEARFVDRLDRHPVVTRPVPRRVLQLQEGRPQRRPRPGLHPEEQTELARRADGPARLRYGVTRCGHSLPPRSLRVPVRMPDTNRSITSELPRLLTNVRTVSACADSPAPGDQIAALRFKDGAWCGAPPGHERREVPVPRSSSPSRGLTWQASGPTTSCSPGSAVVRPYGVSPFRQPFEDAAHAIGIPGLHPHQLRHTAASTAIASGADVKVVQQMLGHASAAMTLDTYGHLFEDRLDEVGDAMDAARTVAVQRRAALPAVPAVAPVLPQTESGRDGRKVPNSVSAGQHACSTLHPQRDSNPCYRRERATS